MPPFRAEPPLLIKPSKLEGEPLVPGGRPNSVTKAALLIHRTACCLYVGVFSCTCTIPRRYKSRHQEKQIKSRNKLQTGVS